MDLDQLRSDRASQSCTSEPTYFLPQLENELYSAMVENGFFYDAKESTWHRDSKKGSWPEGTGIEGWAGQNLLFRYLTERLSSSEKQQVMNEALANLSMEERFSVYNYLIYQLDLYGFDQSGKDSFFPSCPK